MPRACAAALFVAFQAFAQPAQPLQTASSPTSPTVVGLENDWDIAPVLQEIAKHTDKLIPALDRIDARSWVDQGASETYAEQVQLAKDMAKEVAATARELAENPEQLAASINVFIRMKNLDMMLVSLEEGIRKYQKPADAQALAGLEVEASRSREQFQRYIINLAAAREQDLKVMDVEAQRCRSLVTAPPPSTAKSIKKK